MRTPFTGVGTALVTPFTKAGDLDEAAVRRLGRRQIDAGVHFLVPCGTTGESPTLTARRARAHRRDPGGRSARQDARFLPARAVTTRRKSSTSPARCEGVGAGGLLSVTPYYNKPTQEGLLPALPRDRGEHAAADLRLQRARPHRRERRSLRRSSRLAAIPNIVGVKEASGNMTQMCEVCRAVPPDFIVLSGDDVLTLPLMAVGGRGIISVASNEIPAEMAQMVEAAERDDFAAARAMHARILPLMQVNFIEANPVPVKAAMAAMGLLEEVYRLPMVPPRPESKEKIVKVLKELDLVNKPALV